jgi:hypothetical protein
VKKRKRFCFKRKNQKTSRPEGVGTNVAAARRNKSLSTSFSSEKEGFTYSNKDIVK